MTELTYMAGFDTETTGVDVLNDRIVTASIVYVDGHDQILSEHEWLIDPGIEIPAGAAEVHGITTEYAREHGVPAPKAIYDIAMTLAYFLANDVPVVAYNAQYDFSILNRECERHLGYSFGRFFHGEEIPKSIIDPVVIDKKVDKFRPGSRTLTAATEFYDVKLDNAHESRADALGAIGVTRALWERYPALQQAPLDELYNQQILWYADQMEGLKKNFQSRGKDTSDIHTTWPIRTE